MTEYILRLIGEGPNKTDALEILVEGDVPRKDEVFTLEKEYPACIVTYRVMEVSPMNIKIPKDPPKDPPKIYRPDTPVVSVFREPGGFKKR